MRATTRSTPNVSRASRAEMMLELSPLDTPANASGFWSMTATECPRASRVCASVEPTRPHPMITMCTRAPPGPPYRCSSHRLPCAATDVYASLSRTPRPPGLTLDGRGQSLRPVEASAHRPAVPVRPDAPHAVAQTRRAAGVRLRRVVLGRLRAGRDPVDALRGRGRVLCVLAVDRAVRRRRHVDRRG